MQKTIADLEHENLLLRNALRQSVAQGKHNKNSAEKYMDIILEKIAYIKILRGVIRALLMRVGN